MAFFESIGLMFDTLLSPFLVLPPLAAVILMAAIVALLSTLATKYFTKQDEMKALKEEMKALQSQMKELKAHPEKALEVQQRSMEANLKYMSHSMRGTLFSLLPIIIIFNWMSGHFGYIPIGPEQQFTMTAQMVPGYTELVTLSEIIPAGLEVVGPSSVAAVGDRATFALKGKAGDYVVSFASGNTTAERSVRITSERKFSPQAVDVKNGVFEQLSVDYQKLILLPVGYKDWFGWFGTYFFAVILVSSLLRKYMKVY